ncbi:MAG: TetR/AcrR family transcriptional regulator [Candidatus Cloacimonetes bacterium]|nr:TetR/AcrR family transcriptional regulator [Candidatus Cloacimonadota bacterium]
MSTRLKIIENALELFLKKGYDKTSMNEIANKIGISKPAIYHHFKNKESLALSVVDFFEEKTRKWSIEKCASLKSAEDFLDFFIRSIPTFQKIENVILDCDSTDFSMGFNDLISALSRENSALKQKVTTIFDNTRRNISFWINDAQNKGLIDSCFDSDTTALLLHSVVEGMSVIGNFYSQEELTIKTDNLLVLLKKLLLNIK